MVSRKDNLFRAEALERAASPEQIDQIIRLVSQKNWLPLAAIGSLIAAGLILGGSVASRLQSQVRASLSIPVE